MIRQFWDTGGWIIWVTCDWYFWGLGIAVSLVDLWSLSLRLGPVEIGVERAWRPLETAT